MVAASSLCSFVEASVVPVNASVYSNREEQDDLYRSMLTVALQRVRRGVCTHASMSDCYKYMSRVSQMFTVPSNTERNHHSLPCIVM
jgi:hypothetical protein